MKTALGCFINWQHFGLIRRACRSMYWFVSRAHRWPMRNPWTRWFWSARLPLRASSCRPPACVSALAADTDGIDGTEENAGAFIDSSTLERGQALGLDAKAYLANNDATGFFSQTGDLLLTGPTLTNVNDVRVILVD